MSSVSENLLEENPELKESLSNFIEITLQSEPIILDFQIQIMLLFPNIFDLNLKKSKKSTRKRRMHLLQW